MVVFALHAEEEEVVEVVIVQSEGSVAVQAELATADVEWGQVDASLAD